MMNRKVFFRTFALILIFSMLLCGSAAYADIGSTELSDAKNAIVRVFAEFRNANNETIRIQHGSAFAVGKYGEAPEYFITNAHVCLDDSNRLADKIYILLDNDAVEIQYASSGNFMDVEKNTSKMIECDVVNRNLSLAPDVAVLHAHQPVESRKPLPLIEYSSYAEDGGAVYALGFPADIDVLTVNTKNVETLVADVNEVTISNGILSKKTVSELVNNSSVIVHSAPISGGSSGGPLLDKNGAVIGINTWSLTANDSNHLALYIDYAKDILDMNMIPYEVYGQKDMTKTILLCVIMAAVVVLAAVLILNFKNKEKQWIENEEREKRIRENTLRLQGVSGTFAGRRFPLEGQVSLGRNPSNSIAFPADTSGVSGNHCVIMKNGDQVFVKDLGSSFGTVINGTRRLPANQAVPVNVGDRISLGSDIETFTITRKGGKV